MGSCMQLRPMVFLPWAISMPGFCWFQQQGFQLRCKLLPSTTMREEEHSFALIRAFFRFYDRTRFGFALILYVFLLLASRLIWRGQDFIPIMQSLAWGVLIFPSMSVIRGFFQGMNNLKPYAMSQIAEQVIRVIWMLLATFIIMKLGSGII